MLLQTAMPLLAVRLGASWIMLGTIGWVAQAIRTPICFTSGHLSERVGRAAIIVPSAPVCAFMIWAMAGVESLPLLLVLYAVAMASIGAFYPPLQATVGDVSQVGQLRINLGAFNIGWCVGGAVAAWTAGWLVASRIPALLGVGGLSLLFYAGAGCCILAAILYLTWRAKPVPHVSSTAEQDAVEGQPGAIGTEFASLLLISRMGHFVGFFGYSIVRILFPKLGISAFGWSEATVAKVVALFLWGLGAGILLTNLSAWWRGKLWPQLAAQCVMLACAVAIALLCLPLMAFARFPYLIGLLFFIYGVGQSISYTGALYYGLSSRKGKGTNTGIHESLVAAASVSGCLLGGIVAQKIALVAPFVLTAALAGLSVAATCYVWVTRPERAVSA